MRRKKTSWRGPAGRFEPLTKNVKKNKKTMNKSNMTMKSDVKLNFEIQLKETLILKLEFLLLINLTNMTTKNHARCHPFLLGIRMGNPL